MKINYWIKLLLWLYSKVKINSNFFPNLKDKNKNIIFVQCHQVVDPLSYILACQFDVCHSKNKQRSACRDVEAYARECQRHGLCFDWRSDGLCPFECPAGQQYHPCGPGCQKTCTNIGEKCDFEDVEGCFCPDGQVSNQKYFFPVFIFQYLI